MTEISHSELEGFIAQHPEPFSPSVVLIWGDEFLCRRSFKTVLRALLPKMEKDLGYEPLEGDDAAASSIVERLTTLSMMLDRRVIAVKNMLFPPSQGAGAYSSDDVDLLESCIKNGFPDNHFLILTAASMDRRRTFFKLIREIGLCVDATVPEGNRQADIAAKEDVLKATASGILSQSNKRLDTDGFRMLVDRIGYDPGVLSDNLEKLVAYTGSRNRITAADIETLVRRSRQDAVFELTNAVALKQGSAALFYLASLRKSGFHPLQILSALTNQIRKLAAAKNVVVMSMKQGRTCWQPGWSYNAFRQTTMPQVIAWDLALKEKLQGWRDTMGQAPEPGKKDKKSSLTDLFIAPNPKNTYPVYQTFLKTDHYSMQDIATALIAVNQADLKMKSTGTDPSLILDDLVIRLCAKGETP